MVSLLIISEARNKLDVIIYTIVQKLGVMICFVFERRLLSF